jgi:hypothetical protein
VLVTMIKVNRMSRIIQSPKICRVRGTRDELTSIPTNKQMNAVIE